MGCSVAFARYDAFLKQLAKVPLTMADTFDMIKSSKIDYWGKQVTPNPYKVFLYTSEQLSDSNTTRQEHFRVDLQDFLELDAPFGNFADVPKVNSNSEKYPEYIDICDPEYDNMRTTLIKMGTRSSEWILETFVKSKDVIVSNEAFFEASLRTWSIDPCLARDTFGVKNGPGPTFSNPKITGPKVKGQNNADIMNLGPQLKGPKKRGPKRTGIIVV